MKKLTALLLASLMVLSMTACGSTPADSKNPDSGSEASESTGTENASDDAGTESASDDAGTENASGAEGFTTAVEGKLIMATNAAFPPYEYVEGGQVAGIDAEIATAIAQKLGLELQIDDMEFDSITGTIASGKADIGMAGMTITPDRQEEVDFTVSYATGIQVVIVTQDSAITSVDDLTKEGASHVVGVQRNTTGDVFASDDIEKKGFGSVDRYSKGADAVQALKTGKVDCVIIDNEPAKAFVAEVEGLKILETEYAVEDYAAAMSKSNPALYEAVNTALQELIADGTVQGIIDKYINAEIE